MTDPLGERGRRYLKLQDIGCLACRYYGHVQPADMHHQLKGTHRQTDRETVPLCEWHHRGVWNLRFRSRRLAESLLGPSLALTPNDFRDRFGSDEDMLKRANDLLAGRITVADLLIAWPFSEGEA